MKGTVKATKLLTTGEWYDLMRNKYGVGGGVVALEQAMYQSEHNKVCYVPGLL